MMSDEPRHWPQPVYSAKPLRVFFARSKSVTPPEASIPYALLVPDPPKYNNFGRYYWAEFHLFGGKEGPLQLAQMLMFAGDANTHEYLKRIFDGLGRGWASLDEVTNPFVTLFNDENSYGTLVKSLGFVQAIATLRSINDAVAIQEEGLDASEHSLVRTTAFHEGVVRSQDTFSALRRGGRQLTPFEREARQDARARVDFRARLPVARRGVHAIIDFTTDDPLRDRLAVLIGRNGVGKTQLMLALVEGLRHPDGGRSYEVEGADVRSFPFGARVLVLSSVAGDRYPKKIPAWSGLDYEYMTLVDRSDGRSKNLLRTLVDCTRDPADRPFSFRGVELDRYGLMKQLLRRLGLFEGLQVPLLPPGSEVDVFTNAKVTPVGRYVALGSVGSEQRSIRLVAEADYERPLIVISEDNEVRALSSGEVAMLRFVVFTVSTIEMGSFLILEEPETYLHPNYVSEMMSILHDLLEATSSVAIAITHSAYVVREAGRERVKALRGLPEGLAELVPAPIQTFGASVDSISQFVFGDGGKERQFEETLRRWLDDRPEMTVELLTQEHALQFNPETMTFLIGLLHQRSRPSSAHGPK
jgi:ABC-type branched-subunit amino acid transport system ATPase component